MHGESLEHFGVLLLARLVEDNSASVIGRGNQSCAPRLPQGSFDLIRIRRSQRDIGVEASHCSYQQAIRGELVTAGLGVSDVGPSNTPQVSASAWSESPVTTALQPVLSLRRLS